MDGRAATVVLRGDLDVAAVGWLRVGLRDALSRGPRALVVDLGGVTLCAAAALHVLLEATADAETAGVPWAVVAGGPAARRAIEAAGLVDRLHPVPSAAAAPWLSDR
ncbi:hypothetical protein BJP25_15345 [Actinokineospora bangkokensis]|uniref:STAS domain-containing protein n=1 Tax=Actinokineospora bangkokensis TaxID=1193682 RepID=A0A1Q9LPH9_9PSEU|nr:hypothetical protein BJP25_15345 [Actinokineospora bangkokensis]